jgi:hypothetical protein
MDVAHAIIPLVGMTMPFAFVIILVAVIFYFRSRDKADMQKTMRMAIERGDALPTDLLDNLRSRKRQKTPMGDIRAGIILIAVAGGFMAWNYIDRGHIGGGLSGFAAIPGLIGVALLILGIIGSITRKD